MTSYSLFAGKEINTVQSCETRKYCPFYNVHIPDVIISDAFSSHNNVLGLGLTTHSWQIMTFSDGQRLPFTGNYKWA